MFFSTRSGLFRKSFAPFFPISSISILRSIPPDNINFLFYLLIIILLVLGRSAGHLFGAVGEAIGKREKRRKKRRKRVVYNKVDTLGFIYYFGGVILLT